MLSSRISHEWIVRLRASLYLALLLCGTGVLLIRPHLVEAVRASQLSPIWLVIGPIAFAVLFLIYVAGEAFRYVKRSVAHPIALLPIVCGGILLAILMPSSIREYQARHTQDPVTHEFLSAMFSNKDARVRALVILAAQSSPLEQQQWTQLVDMGLSDTDPLVQHAAQYLLGERTGIVFSKDSSGLVEAKEALKGLINSSFEHIQH